MLDNQFVKKLQEKPEPVKHIIMWAAVSIVMILVFGLWLWNFSKIINQPNELSEVSPPAQSQTSSLPSTWSTFKSQFKNILDLLKNIK